MTFSMLMYATAIVKEVLLLVVVVLMLMMTARCSLILTATAPIPAIQIMIISERSSVPAGVDSQSPATGRSEGPSVE